MKKFFSAFLIFASIAVSCSKDDNNAPEKETIDYDALSAKSVELFLDFAKTPRPCLSLDKARDYLKKWCETNHYTFNRDEYGNVWFDVPATNGYESYPNIILQGHMDMVCACEEGLEPDYTKEVGTPEWVGTELTGSGINLGADNGIGVGISLAIATSGIPHGPLRILVTADEDAGLLGARDLPSEVLNANYLINLDSEELGSVISGCAGNVRSRYERDFDEIPKSDNEVKVEMNLGGLKGGHSGIDIGKGRLSAAVALNRVLDSAIIPFHGKLITVKCGSAENSIATNFTLSFSVTKNSVERVKAAFTAQMNRLKKEYPDESFTFSSDDKDLSGNDYVMDENGGVLLSALFKAVPMGAIEFSKENPERVTKSRNIGIVTVVKGHISFYFSTRSDYNDWLSGMKAYYRQVADENTLKYTISSEYPAWQDNSANQLRDMTLTYYKQYVSDAYISVSMGGLEPSLFSQKSPNLQMVCIGPDITGAHSISETLHTETIRPLLQTLVQILLNANQLK